MAAATATAGRSIVILRPSEPVSSIIVGDFSLAQTDLSGRFVSRRDDAGFIHGFLLDDRTVILPIYRFAPALAPPRARRYTGTGRHRAMRRRMVAKSRRGIATSAI